MNSGKASSYLAALEQRFCVGGDASGYTRIIEAGWSIRLGPTEWWAAPEAGRAMSAAAAQDAQITRVANPPERPPLRGLHRAADQPGSQHWVAEGTWVRTRFGQSSRCVRPCSRAGADAEVNPPAQNNP